MPTDEIGQVIFDSFRLDSGERSWLTINGIASECELSGRQVATYIVENMQYFEIAPIAPGGITLIGPAVKYYKHDPRRLNKTKAKEVVFYEIETKQWITLPFKESWWRNW